MDAVQVGIEDGEVRVVAMLLFACEVGEVVLVGGEYVGGVGVGEDGQDEHRVVVEAVVPVGRRVHAGGVVGNGQPAAVSFSYSQRRNGVSWFFHEGSQSSFSGSSGPGPMGMGELPPLHRGMRCL